VKLTADTITDEQVRGLESDELRRLRTWALADRDPVTGARPSRAIAARARCAEILNARGDAQ